MYSENFVQHMFQKANELINIEREQNIHQFSKRIRAHDKLDYNVKRLMDFIPKELQLMTIDQLLNQFGGDLDLAAHKLVKLEEPVLSADRMYNSPPKVQSKKRNLKKKIDNQA